MKECKAYIDSFYHGSAVDGEGLRSVLFFAGCNLKCPFCHNPETLVKPGRELTLADAVRTIKRYLPYLSGGGITLSGGEPFLQSDFCKALSREAHALGLTVIAETNGLIPDAELIAQLDGVRLDVKNQSGESGGQLTARLAPFLDECRKNNTDVLLTNVLCPGVNDGEKAVAGLAELKKRFPFCRGVEFLAFKKLCANKYAELGLNFGYASVPEANKADVDRAAALFKNSLKLKR